MKFSDDFINRVRDSSNIVEIISQNTELKRTGNNLMGRCPFPDHREKTPSFSVNEQKQVYHCFGCKKGGDIFKFLEGIRGMNFPEAVEFLAERAGIPVPKDSYEGVSRDDAREQKKLLFKINKLASHFFRKSLTELSKDHPVLRYMDKRGLSTELAEEFQIGYAPPDWSLLTDYLVAKKVPVEWADKLGLLRRRTGQGQSGYFDMFRDRLMFPILSVNEEVVGFGGRILGDGQPKYLNSPESPVFHKGQTFYGLHAAAKYIRTEDEVIVVEGYMDMLALYSGGVKNVVATLGTALTHEHAKLIARYTKNVLVLFDSDAAGIQASERSLPILLAEGLLPRGTVLPQGKDPDDAIRLMGSESFKVHLAKASDLFFLSLDRALEGYRGQPTEKVQVVDRVGKILLQIKDVKLRELYSTSLRERLNVEDKWLRFALTELSKKTEKSYAPAVAVQAPRAAEPVRKITIQKAAKEEVLLINLMLFSEEYLKLAIAADVRQFLGQSEMGEMFEIIEKLYGQSSQNFARLSVLLSERLQTPELILRHLDQQFQSMAEEKGEEMAKDCLDRIKVRHLEKEGKRLMEQLKVRQDPQMLEQFMNIQRERLALKNS